MPGARTVDPCRTDVDEVADQTDPAATFCCDPQSPEAGRYGDGLLGDTVPGSHDEATGSREPFPSPEQRGY